MAKGQLRSVSHAFVGGGDMASDLACRNVILGDLVMISTLDFDRDTMRKLGIVCLILV